MSCAATPLIVPVENQVRELDGKLLLAAIAAERGFRVVIGSRFDIHFALPFLPRGLVLAKSLRNVSSYTLAVTRRLGHEIAAWDEEGLVRFPSPEYFDWRYSKHAFATVSRLFSWGVDDAEFFKRYDGYTGVPIHVTGNPRADLLRHDVRNIYAEEAAALRRRYGRFILINTNFSFANNFVKDLNLIRLKPNGDHVVSRTGRGLSDAFALGMARHQEAIFAAFKRLLPVLGAHFKGTSIVLRPHPSEDPAPWQALARNFDNVHVLGEGNVIPWLMACDVLLHNGCTTAVEASMLETPAVAYRPVTSADYDYSLPNSLSHEAFSVCDTIARLEDILERDLGAVDVDKRRAICAHHLAGGSEELACDRVVDVLAHEGYLDRVLPRPRLPTYLSGWLGMNARTLVQRASARRPGSRHSPEHQRRRFPTVNATQLSAKIERMGSELNRFHRIEVAPLGQNIFAVEAT